MATHHNSILEPVPVADRREIQKQLEDILRSVPFRTSRQCQDLFRYVVEHTLSGNDESLRERVIGIEVFGRAPHYDTAEDPVVRLRAADVRKRLAQYYQADKNVPSKWRIDVPTGSYKAQFHRLEPAPPQVVVAEPPLGLSERPTSNDTHTLLPAARHRRRRIFWLAMLVMGCLVAVVAALVVNRRVSPAESALDVFWDPVLASPRPVLVCTGSNRVYILSDEARARYHKMHPSPEDGTPNLETLVPKEDMKGLRGEEFIPVKDTYLTIGDAAVTSQISSLLTARHHAFDLRFGSDLSFGDLRGGSAVLIGAFNNSWTLNMTDSFRFVFDSGDSPEMHVQDRLDRLRSWWPKFSPERKFTEDYAIVSRILDSKTGNVLITIAGLDHTGTQAAGDFVTNPQRIADLIKQAPKDWNRKNLQVVLHTTISNGIPGSPTVVAAHYW